MKTTEDLNELKEESLEAVTGGQEPQEFDWKGPEYTTPIKEDIKKGHVFRPVRPTLLEDNGKDIEYIHIRPGINK